MFGFGKKPEAKAVISIQRNTGIEEHSSVTVNAYSMDSQSIYEAIKAAAGSITSKS